MSTPASTFEPVPSDQQRWKDEEHLRLLSIFHFVVGGFAALFLPLLCIHFLMFITIFANASAIPAGNDQQPFPREMIYLLIAFYCVAGLAALVYAGGNLLSGWFLRQKRHRVFSFVVAGLDCLSMPWGTILGIFTIIVLTRPSVRSMYEAGRRRRGWMSTRGTLEGSRGV